MSDEPLKPPDGKKWCKQCYSEIDKRASICAGCKTVQAPTKWCRICAQPMDEDTLRCNACGAYLGWRRFVLFSAPIFPTLTAFFAVLAVLATQSLNLLNYHSKTSIKVTGSDSNTIFVKVRNAGQQPSELVSYRLLFNDVQIESADLILGQIDQQEPDNVIKTADPVKIGLTINRELLRKPKPGGGVPYTKAEIEKQLHTATVELDIMVQESGDKAGKHQKRYDSFTGDRIKQFVIGGIHW